LDERELNQKDVSARIFLLYLMIEVVFRNNEPFEIIKLFWLNKGFLDEN
jgi:hypothetical protein